LKKVRIGVIGTGGMGQGHCQLIASEQLQEAGLTAVCDIVPEVAQQVGNQYKVPCFLKHTDLLNSGLVDAVTIATPHYFHPPIAIDAFKRGLHVLSEKPIGVTVKAANQMIRAAARSKKIFSVMFQHRYSAVNQAAKKLIDAGKLGELQRTNLIVADYRSQAYYNSAGWRATWKGEGGGVLLNQAPHSLDIFCWLTGRAKFIAAQTRTQLHTIEVEDQAFAVLEYPNGAHGYVYASTTDIPQTTRIEICGDKGKILLDDQGLRFWKITPPVSNFTRENKAMWGAPQAEQVKVELPSGNASHLEVLRNFCRGILHNEPLHTPGAEGLYSLELANAIILSSYRAKPVRLPLNGNEYEELLEELRQKSKIKRGITDHRETDVQHAKQIAKVTKK